MMYIHLNIKRQCLTDCYLPGGFLVIPWVKIGIVILILNSVDLTHLNHFMEEDDTEELQFGPGGRTCV